MDFTLRCNSLKCRSQLTDRAVVTTCSHIFCIQCSEQLGLANAAGHRVCPACRTALTNPDDVVATQLNPTEDYKTSVLSGLSPTAIMECAGRGLAFWAYQSTQEIVYQEYLAKTLTDKYSTLNNQLDKVINDANSEIENLNQRLNQMHLDQQALKTDNQNLMVALREKNRKHAQTQELYDRLKRKEMTAATQHAAYDSADDVLQTVVRGQQGETSQLRRPQHGSSPLGRNGAGIQRHSGSPDKFQHSGIIGGGGERGHMPPPNIPRQGQGQNGGFAFHPSVAHLQSTPSLHRTPLGSNLGPNNSLIRRSVGNGAAFGSSSLSGKSPKFRRPLNVISGNEIRRGGEGYGMSAGMRQGSVQGYESGADFRGV